MGLTGTGATVSFDLETLLTELTLTQSTGARKF